MSNMKDSLAQIHDLELDVTKYFPSFDRQEIILKGKGVCIGVNEIAPDILHVYLYKTPRADDLLTNDLLAFELESKYDEIVYAHSMPDKMDDLINKLDMVGYKYPMTLKEQVDAVLASEK